MKTNTFRNNQSPSKSNWVIPEDRKHDFKQRTLTPPVFEEDRREVWNKNIAYSQTIIRGDFGKW